MKFLKRIGAALVDLIDGAEERHRAQFEADIRAAAKAGDVRWSGAVKDISRFRVLFYAPRQENLAIGVLASRAGTLYLALEHYALRSFSAYDPLSGTHETREEYAVTRREVRRIDSVGAVEAIMDARPYSAEQLGRLYERFEKARRPSRRQAAEAMTHEEACAVLNVAVDASPAEIKQAFYSLSRRLHPDHGGSPQLMKQLNVARDILVRNGGG